MKFKHKVWILLKTKTMKTTARQMVEKLTKEELITEIYHLLIILPIKEQKYQKEFINNKKQKQ